MNVKVGFGVIVDVRVGLNVMVGVFVFVGEGDTTGVFSWIRGEQALNDSIRATTIKANFFMRLL